MSDQEDKLNKYVDLKINGRMFPSWINLNFKKYKLDDVLKTVGDDPCNIKGISGEHKLELKKYQTFIGQFLDFRSPYKTILLYHFLGTGNRSQESYTISQLIWDATWKALFPPFSKMEMISSSLLW